MLTKGEDVIKRHSFGSRSRTPESDNYQEQLTSFYCNQPIHISNQQARLFGYKIWMSKLSVHDIYLNIAKTMAKG